MMRWSYTGITNISDAFIRFFLKCNTIKAMNNFKEYCYLGGLSQRKFKGIIISRYKMAEEERFELSVDFHPRQFSRLLP